MYGERKCVKVLYVCMYVFVLVFMHQSSLCVAHSSFLHASVRRMKFQVEMICVASCVNKYLHLSAIAGFVLNSRVEGGCGSKLLVSELVAQIGLLEVVDATQ